MAQDMFSLEGRVALVTGGNSGLGRAMALAFKEAGAQVAIASRRADKNAEVARELGDPAAAYELDVRDEGSVEQVVAAVVERMGHLDILVNNAGTVNRISVLEMELSEWERVIATNLTGAFLCTKHAGRVMARQGSGKIINISSGYGIVAPSKGLQVAYTASKHGLIGLTRVNAVELAPLGIQVNAILPGWHITEINQELTATPLGEAISRRTPTGRWGEPSDLVGTCIYLASSASDFVTGSCAVVDGGYLTSDGLDRG